jgi:hypothetical protein
MRQTRKRRILIVTVSVYCALWLLTATWGISDIDRAFDQEFAYGLTGMGDAPKKVPIRRIEKMANVRILDDPANQFPDDIGLFRYRTRGFAVAPFIIIDEAATVYATLGGFGGMRINFWFFGYTNWWPLKCYWAV